MHLKPGLRLHSTVCSTEVIIVRPPTIPVDLRCGGAPMAALGTQASAIPPPVRGDTGSQLGKRYADETSGIELLCTKPGDGTLSLGNKVIPLKDAKPLPSSD